MEIAVILIALFGFVLGSFLNAAIYRLANQESIARGRSHCVHCQYQLRWFDLVPLASFVALKGRCRSCSQQIPPDYFFVEFFLGLLFAFAGWQWINLAEPYSLQAILVLIRDLLVILSMAFLFVYDWKYMLLPDAVTLPAVVLFTLISLLLKINPVSIFLGIAIGGGFFLLQYLISKGKWIGGGDIRMGALMGAILSWPLIIVALFVAYLVGSIFAIVNLAIKKKRVGDQIPFGTFLAFSTIVTLWWGEAILGWYLKFL